MAVIFDSIEGHEENLRHLKMALKLRTQSFLFSGPSGVGKKMTALAWAQGLLCQAPDAPCGRCSTCLRAEARRHPDLLLASTEEATIKIETVRDIQNFVSLRAYEGKAKVVIIDESHRLTLQAANALLKTLEEPPSNSHFVLVTSNRGAVLQTIESRCQRVLFGSLSPHELKKIIPDAPAWVCDLSQGRVDSALKLNDESFRKLRSDSLKVLQELPVARTFEGFMMINPLADDRETALFSVHCWSQWVRSALALSLNAKPQILADEEPMVSRLSHLPSEALVHVGEKIMRLEQDLQAHINKNLALEKFWIDARAVLDRN